MIMQMATCMIVQVVSNGLTLRRLRAVVIVETAHALLIWYRPVVTHGIPTITQRSDQRITNDSRPCSLGYIADATSAQWAFYGGCSGDNWGCIVWKTDVRPRVERRYNGR